MLEPHPCRPSGLLGRARIKPPLPSFTSVPQQMLYQKHQQQLPPLPCRMACTRLGEDESHNRGPGRAVCHHRTCLARGSGQGCRWAHLLGGCWCWSQDRRSVPAWQMWCCSWILARTLERTMGLEEKQMPIITKYKTSGLEDGLQEKIC